MISLTSLGFPKSTCFLFIYALNASINKGFTYLLTYLLTYNLSEAVLKAIWLKTLIIRNSNDISPSSLSVLRKFHTLLIFDIVSEGEISIFLTKKYNI